jgi:hypothetical protein
LVLAYQVIATINENGYSHSWVGLSGQIPRFPHHCRTQDK